MKMVTRWIPKAPDRQDVGNDLYTEILDRSLDGYRARSKGALRDRFNDPRSDRLLEYRVVIILVKTCWYQATHLSLGGACREVIYIPGRPGNLCHREQLPKVIVWLYRRGLPHPSI